MGGTTNSPPYASTEISEAAAVELTPSRRPARLKRSGTTGESPAPGSAKAARQKTGLSQKQSIKPAAAAVRLPPVISTPSVRRRRRSSPTRRQTTIAAAKAAKADAAASSPAPVIRSKAPHSADAPSAKYAQAAMSPMIQTTGASLKRLSPPSSAACAAHEGRSKAPKIGGTGCRHQTGRSRKNTRRKNPAAAKTRHKPGRCRNHQNGRDAKRQKKPQAAFALIRPSLTYRIRSTRLPKAMSPHKKGTKRSALLSP